MATEAQKRASAKYDKENMKRCTVVFSPNEMDLFEFLNSQESKSGFLKELLRREMESEERK